MARALPDRRARLFGRERDLAALLARTRHKGVTAVAGRPQMGKSWLLAELARRLAGEQEPPWLVGVAESSGQSPDLLLRAIADLYARWLADARALQQAKMAWKQQQPHVLPGVAKALAKVFNWDSPDAGLPKPRLRRFVASDKPSTASPGPDQPAEPPTTAF